MKIGDVCNTISSTYKRADSEVVLINTSDVLDGIILNHTLVPNKDLKGQFKKTFKKNDILYSEIRPANKRFAFVDIENTESYIASTKLMVIRPNCELIRPKFLYTILKSQSIIDELQALAETRSGTFPQITFEGEVSQLEFELPSFDVQDKIVSILESIDTKIAVNQQINDNLEQQALAIVENALNVGEPIPLAQIMSFENGFAFQSSTYQQAGKYRVITIKNVQDGYIDSTGAAFLTEIPCKMKPSCLLKPGDALLSLTGNVGRVGIVYEDNLLLNQRVAKICSKKSEWLPFLYFWFRMPSTKISLETIAKGTAQQNLSPVETLKTDIPFDETRVNDCAGLLSTIYAQILNNSQENMRLAAIRDALLPKLMSGEIDVSDVQV